MKFLETEETLYSWAYLNSIVWNFHIRCRHFLETVMKETKTVKVHSFFSKEKYKIAMKWKNFESCHFIKYKEPSGNYLALFDLDNTIISTKSGKGWSANIDDWKLKPNVEAKLSQVVNDGGFVCIVTNQLDTKNNTSAKLHAKIGNVIKRLDIPLYVFMSTKRDYYRKPCPGMFDLLLRELSQQFDLASSYFVGDAAGRPSDHADTDLKWAMNVGLKFLVPEVFFDDQESLPFTISYRPSEMFTHTELIKASSSRELVILIGMPASGKTFISKSVFAEYVHVNQDVLKTKDNCVLACKSALSEGKSVIIDNTNPTIECRNEYIKMAAAAGVKCRIIWLKFPKEWCLHLDMYRSLTEKRALLPKMAFISFGSSLQKPSNDECHVDVVEQIYCKLPNDKLMKHLV
eukprot:NODE_387_length_9532_cov_0.176402.p2 type:complete len:403 gc:universal NODE_387_length_9532_cov_0.176402:2702-3910(+)